MGLDALDLNALTSDLNARIDEFIAEDLATDQAARMQALPMVRKDAAAPDSARRPPTLFVMPTWSKARVDSFEARVRHFYREVQDPWFAHYLDYSFAGLRHGPRVNDDELFKHHLASKPVIYDDPEYVRFVRSFFAEQLASADRHHGPALRHALESANLDSLNAVLMRNDFLKDEHLRELVMIDLLHQQYHGSVVSASIEQQLEVDKIVFYSDEVITGDIWEETIYDKKVQEGSDLGKRMANAFKFAFSKGYRKAIIIGSDCFDITPKIIKEAFAGLPSNNFVIGPTHDGGYYLLGMATFYASVFKNKRWSSDEVLHDTLIDIRNINGTYKLLEELTDIDKEADLDAVKNIAS